MNSVKRGVIDGAEQGTVAPLGLIGGTVSLQPSDAAALLWMPIPLPVIPARLFLRAAYKRYQALSGAAARGERPRIHHGVARKNDSIVGERGVKLSVGKKHASLEDPPIRILDEAKASVDTHPQTLIEERLKHLAANRTCFRIAHRLSTVSNTDQIPVLDHGRPVEHGSYRKVCSPARASPRASVAYRRRR